MRPSPPHRLRHIIILRVAARRRAAFVWGERASAGARRRAHRRRDHRHRVTGRRTVRFRRRGRPAAGGRRPHRRRCRLSCRVADRWPAISPHPELVDVVFTAGCYNTVASVHSVDRARGGSRPRRPAPRRGIADETGAVRLPRAHHRGRRRHAAGVHGDDGQGARRRAEPRAHAGAAAHPLRAPRRYHAGWTSCRHRASQRHALARRGHDAGHDRAVRRPSGRPCRCSRGRPRSSGTSRSATAARSVARSPMPTRPPSSPRSPSRSTPTSRCSRPRGRRTLPASEFFTGTWSTALGDDEVLVAVGFPVWEGRVGFGFDELARRHGDFALAGAAVAVESTTTSDRHAAAASDCSASAPRLSGRRRGGGHRRSVGGRRRRPRRRAAGRGRPRVGAVGHPRLGRLPGAGRRPARATAWKRAVAEARDA